MCGCFCIGCVYFTLKGKCLLEYTNLFSPNNYEKNDKMKLKYIQQLKRWKSYIVLIVVSIENLKNPKSHTSWERNPKNMSSFYYSQ